MMLCYSHNAIRLLSGVELEELDGMNNWQDYVKSPKNTSRRNSQIAWASEIKNSTNSNAVKPAAFKIRKSIKKEAQAFEAGVGSGAHKNLHKK